MAKKKGRRSLAREKFWREKIRLQAESGKTVRQFCEEHKLGEHSFHSWKKEIRLRDREGAETKQPSPAFIPIKVKDNPVGGGVGEPFIELITPSGYACKIPAGLAQDVCQLIFKGLVQK